MLCQGKAGKTLGARRAMTDVIYAPSPELVKAQWVIEAELTEFVGPIAPLLCCDHITKAAAAGPPLDLRALVEAAARELGLDFRPPRRALRLPQVVPNTG